jgi:hypothetical protein
MKSIILVLVLFMVSCEKQDISNESVGAMSLKMGIGKKSCAYPINERDTFDIGPAGNPILKEFIGVGNRWIYTDSLFTTEFKPAHCKWKVFAIGYMSVDGQSCHFLIVSALKNGQLPEIPIEPYVVFRKGFQPFNKEPGDNWSW